MSLCGCAGKIEEQRVVGERYGRDNGEYRYGRGRDYQCY